jgi:hypothetical protein
MPIGLPNDDIYDLSNIDGSESGEDYLSTLKEDDDDADGDGENFMWPPEVLHAPSSSRKRHCKRKALVYPALDDVSYPPTVNVERGDAHGGEAVRARSEECPAA